jgi:uncharacterized protein (DUF362 family)
MEKHKPRVSVVTGTDIEATIRNAVELVGGIAQVVRPGQTVMIKPNFGVPVPPETGVITDPEAVEAVIKICKEAGPGKILVAESTVVGFDTADVFIKLGLEKRFQRAGARLVDLDQDDIVEIPVPDGTVLKKIKIFKTAFESDVIISVPTMKTHILTQVTLGLKNMKGILPDSMKKRMHRIGAKKKVRDFELDHAIADLNSVIPPTFTIIDGFTANEGYKPGAPGIGGTPFRFNTTVAGHDPVAVDTVGAYLMGYEPNEVRHIRYTGAKGVGIADMDRIDIRGENPERIRRPFQRPSLDGLLFDFKDISVIGGKGCSGCREACYIALSGMTESQLEKIGKSTVMFGADVDLTEIEKDTRLYLVGNCTFDNPVDGERIEGCPPPGIHVRQCLLGTY